MKNIPKFTVEVLVTIIVATLVSAAIGAILAFIFGNLQFGDEGMVYVNTVSSTIFGLVVGYKLNSLIRTHR